MSFSGPNNSYAAILCQILSTVHCCYSYTAFCCISSHRRHPVKFISLSGGGGGGETVKCRAVFFGGGGTFFDCRRKIYLFLIKNS